MNKNGHLRRHWWRLLTLKTCLARVKDMPNGVDKTSLDRVDASKSWLTASYSMTSTSQSQHNAFKREKKELRRASWQWNWLNVSSRKRWKRFQWQIAQLTQGVSPAAAPMAQSPNHKLATARPYYRAETSARQRNLALGRDWWNCRGHHGNKGSSQWQWGMLVMPSVTYSHSH